MRTSLPMPTARGDNAMRCARRCDFERDFMRARTTTGLAAAKRNGASAAGRSSRRRRREADARLPEVTGLGAWRVLRCGRSTLYRIIA